MRKFFAVAVGSMVALVGFAGAAYAGATVELIWQSTGTDTIEDVASGAVITMDVVITGGPEGVSSAGLSIDYSDPETAGTTELVSFACTGGAPAFQFCLSNGIDTGSQINTMSVGGFSGGLANGQTVTIGTATFRKIANPDGTFTFPVGVLVSTDDLFDLSGQNISATSTYNPAFLVNVPEPGAIAMLAMGLGGVLLAGRGRRS